MSISGKRPAPGPADCWHLTAEAQHTTSGGQIVTVDSGQWTLDSDCGLWTLGRRYRAVCYVTPWRSSNQRISWDTSCPVSTGATPGKPENWTLKDGLNRWYFTMDTFTLATLLPGRTGAGGVGLVATSPRPTPTSTSPSPSCSGLPRWGPGSGQSCWSELVLANIQLLFDARWCSNVTKIIPNFTRGLVPPPRTGALKTSSSKFKVWSFSLKTY